MPETGFSIEKIKIHLRKWIGLYLAATIGLCFLNHLIYTVTRPSFSDDERLKIMLLNVESVLSDEEYADFSAKLLPELQALDPGILTLEFEQLPFVQEGDAGSEMMLSVKFTGGFGDLYLTDEAGLAFLQKKNLCGPTEFIENCLLTGGEAYLAIISNTTDMDSAVTALPLVAGALKE